MTVNIFKPHFDEERDWEGFRAHRARLGHQLGTERLGVSFWELPPGQAAYPYHFHFAEEELLVILEGRPSLRTPKGWREVEPGEAVAFPTGEEGAHQLVNRTDEPVRGKVGTRARRPEGGGLRMWFKRDDELGYLDGEEPPSP